MPTRRDQGTFAERADLEDLAAERAASIARYAAAEGYIEGADMFQNIGRRCRVEALKLRALAAAKTVQGWR